jgi:hypothetical protein
VLAPSVQAVLQGQWPDHPTASCLPHMTPDIVKGLQRRGYAHLSDLVIAVNKQPGKLATALQTLMDGKEADDCMQVLARMPLIQVVCSRPELQRALNNEEQEEDPGLGEYSIQIVLSRQSDSSVGSRTSKAQSAHRARVYAPRCTSKLPAQHIWSCSL